MFYFFVFWFHVIQHTQMPQLKSQDIQDWRLRAGVHIK